MSYDSTEDTKAHIQRVQELMHVCIAKLLTRAEVHDRSKLQEPEKSGFDEYTPKLRETTYGSEEYYRNLDKMRVVIQHHYANNSHHPEFARRNEKWLPIVGFENFYEVSDYGNVRSLDRCVERSGPTGPLSRKGQEIRQYRTPRGYCRVQLTVAGKIKNCLVHRLVAEAFLGTSVKPEVNHKNGIKHDNKLDNLEWVTSSENQQHAYETGLKDSAVKYVVACEALGITTFGCCEMETELHKRGYEKVSSSGIYSAIERGGTHLDLEFTATRFDPWMNSPVNDMSLLDILEMLCDWRAAVERHADGSLAKSIEINAERFNIDDTLKQILINTARSMNW